MEVVPRLAFLSHGALPRTSSGKIRRQEARRQFLFGGLRSLAAAEA
jgi:acyl-coenzyme A synthetase/AMP-(fatty) acid ligase